VRAFKCTFVAVPRIGSPSEWFCCQRLSFSGSNVSFSESFLVIQRVDESKHDDMEMTARSARKVSRNYCFMIKSRPPPSSDSLFLSILCQFNISSTLWFLNGGELPAFMSPSPWEKKHISVSPVVWLQMSPVVIFGFKRPLHTERCLSGCRVTGSPGHRDQGHRVTGSQGPGSQGHRVTGSPGPGSQGHRVTGSQGPGSQGHRDQGHRGHRLGGPPVR